MLENHGLESAPYKDKHLSPEARARDLLARMTLEEKVGQLRAYMLHEELSPGNPWAGWPRYGAMSTAERASFTRSINVRRPIQAGIGHFTVFLRDLPPEDAAREANRVQQVAMQETRLGIPVMIHDEGLHGLLANAATIFPQSIALSSTWDPALVEEIASAIGRETRARGIRQLLSPTINIARDGRAGRTEETYGEDPYLTSRFAVVFVRGLQGQGVVATPKHFAANFVGDGGRDSHPIHFSEQLLREVYFPAFQAAVQEAGALSIMAAYNSLDGLPCSCNPWLLSEVLKKEWGFKGYVVSDYGSVEHIYSKHAVAATFGEAGKRALEAGLDVEFPNVVGFGDEFLKGLKDNTISTSALDEAVRRVLETKFRIGLFDEPTVDPDQIQQVNHNSEHRTLALRASRESIVLLKNAGKVLPIATGTCSAAVIGPLADVPSLGGYTWDRVPREQVVTPLDGILTLAGETDIRYVEGCKLTRPIPNGIEAAISAARACDVAIVFVGNSSETEGEGRDRSNLALPGVQADLVKAVAATGTPTIVVLINGSPILVREWLDSVSALVEAWYPGEQGGSAIAEVLFGLTNPSGKLTITFPRTGGQLPLYYNARPSGREQGYADEAGTAMFPFGFGLSYTNFAYRNLEIKTLPDRQYAINLEVENTGKLAGDEVVQLYIHDAVATYSRPVKELKGFQRIHLEPGEMKPLTLKLSANQLGYYTRDGAYTVEAGVFEVLIGSSSEDIRLAGKLTV